MNLLPILELRRDIHRHPETGFAVQRTAAIVAQEMHRLGLSVREGVGQTGVVADLFIPEATSRIALRADMDALPMDEENDLPYRSIHPGKAHMCGHDAHTAMLIGAARQLVTMREKLCSHVRFIFQPSEEELPGGALGMIADGALEGVNEAYALHVWPWLNSGTIGLCRGPTMAKADQFVVNIRGSGGHAAAPHQTVDPILISAHIVTALQSLVSRAIDPLESAVVSITSIHGGTTFNVIPEYCTLKGTVRTYNLKVQRTIRTQMERLVQRIAEGFGATALLEYSEGYPPVINHPAACERVALAAQPFTLIDPAERALFGEDFAYFGQMVPSSFIQLGCRNESLQAIYPLHHPRFLLDEECIQVGISLLVRLCTAE